ncbi:hypothetical protein MGG_16287 [Pyricularia oryzae 70-15]|uniref:RNA polymerase-associated protein LEO1 n=2 Tax=Pyricularia oryzae TaxID=318829 RepID=G4MR31_PYRO7|nr:uncharacterized protein MGG_16287 [Pyricularia oryzae 70-15]EHA57363.1 hypothetical protein MGG_16287 [Pyricularia oryzae 70-15]ELQ36656.1 hypothetical protein OOU_Y34scaffold00648g3 [Pyricularia oryzae Y34]KAI7928665.1 hypothetical protein M9X92_001753 [Pyricularia oryzae]KAI7928717.1 hypothetical protein M0657_002541 [Pyricularia oryzae]
MSDSDDVVDIADAGDEGDLFGDGGDESDIERPLSDHELDDEDDDDQQREREYGESSQRAPQYKEKRIMGLKIFRHRIPKPKDGNLRILKVPQFMKIVPEQYNEDSYEPTAWDLSEDKKKYPASVIRWRKNPETGKLESNANIYRWSDGSISVAVGDQHYDMDAKSLAPTGKGYDEKRDANYYAAAGHLSTEAFLTVGHITEELKVRPNEALEAAAVDRLMAKMDEATKHRHTQDDVIFRATEDPELQRKQAEMAEKERERLRRKKENAAARLEMGFGSSRFSGRSGGLSVGGLESGSGERRRGKGAGDKSRPKRRRPEYDSDDDLPQGARRQDDYDMADGFIAPSDEDISEGEEEDEDEDLLDEDEDRSPPKAKRQKKVLADDDADGDADDAPAAHAEQGGRRGRRLIVDDEDE